MSTVVSTVLANGAALASSARTAPSAIPYRTAASVPAGSVASAMMITLLVLVALVGCALYARRRGWLPGAGAGMRPASGTVIDVRASRRVSLATTLHVVRCDGADYLLVETTRGTTASVSPLPESRTGQETKP